MSKSFISRIIHITKKFTFVDWIVCVVILATLGVFLFNRFAKEEQWVPVRLKVSADEWWWDPGEPQNWYGVGLSGGQAAYNTFGEKVAEIQTVENYDAGEADRLIFVNLKLLTTYNKNSQIHSFNFQPLQIGKSLDLTFQEYNIHGLVTHIGEDPASYSTTRLEVKLLGIYPWEATSYKEGMQMKDLEGNTVATIDRVETQPAQVLEIRDELERLIALPAPYNTYKDTSIGLTLKTYRVGNVDHFINGAAIKVGNRIWIEFENTAIKDAIISAIY